MPWRRAKNAVRWATRWLPGSLRRRFAILLVLLTVASVTPWWMARQLHGELSGQGVRLQLTGALRYQLLEFALVASPHGLFPAPEAQVQRLVRRQDDALHRLLEGDPAVALPPCSHGHLCRTLREHRRRWEGSIRPVALEATDRSLLVPRVLEEMSRLDEAVTLAAAGMETSVDRVARRGLLAMVSLLALLSLVGLGVWDVFSRIRRVELASQGLGDSQPLAHLGRGSDEVATLAATLHRTLRGLRLQHQAERERAVRLDARQGALRYLATRLDAWIAGHSELATVVVQAARAAGFEEVYLEADLLRSARAGTADGCPASDTDPRFFKVPLLWGPHVVGTLCLGRNDPAPLTPEDRAVAEAFAGTVTIAVVARSLLDERDLRGQLTDFLSTLRDLDEGAEGLGERLRQLVQHDHAWLSIRDESGAVEQCWPLGGEGTAAVRPTCALSVGEDVQVLDRGEWAACPAMAAVGPRSALVAPLVVDRRQIGLLLLGRREGSFSSREVEILRTVTPVLASTLERMRLTERLHLSEHLATVGGLSRMVAHEIRNPLNSFALRMRLVERTLGRLALPEGERTSLEEHLAVLKGEQERLDRVVEGYVALATGRNAARFESVDLREVVAEVIAFHRPLMEARRLEVTLDLGEEPALAVFDRTRVAQAIHNLVINAIEAQEGRAGKVAVSLRPTAAGWAVAVADAGPGVQDARRIFSPGYTTKSAGSGMGLAISLQIARLHGGSLLCRNRPTGGAEFVLTLAQEGPSEIPALAAH